MTHMQAVSEAIASQVEHPESIPEAAPCRDCGRTFAEHDWQGGCPDWALDCTGRAATAATSRAARSRAMRDRIRATDAANTQTGCERTQNGTTVTSPDRRR